MSIANQEAAALDAAALAAELEDVIRRQIGLRRLEDVAGLAALGEWSDAPLPGGPRGARIEVRPAGVTIYSRGLAGRVVHAQFTAQQAVLRVLAFRAEDPLAAHARDLAGGERLAVHWRRCYENDCARLSDPTHPAYRDPAKATAADLASEFSGIGGVVWSRDLHSERLAKTRTALAALRAAGPHLPDQPRLF